MTAVGQQLALFEVKVYVCDADALINMYRAFDRKAIRKLRKEIEKGRLKVPEGVYREILRQEDSLKRLFRKLQDQVRIPIKRRSDAILANLVTELDTKYGEKVVLGKLAIPGFWHSASGRKAADAQVVAVAKHFGYIVVSNDQAIHWACLNENVACISWTEYTRRITLLSLAG